MIQEYWSLTEKFLKKGFWLYMFSLIMAPIAYITKIIISWELSVSEVGILYGIISLITLLTSYNDLWVAESLKYFIPNYVSKKDYSKVKSLLFIAFVIQTLSALAIAALFYFGAEYLADNYFKNSAANDALKVFAFFFIGINIFQTFNNFFIAVQDTFLHKFTDFIRTLFTMCCVIFMFFTDLSSLLNYSLTWLISLYIWILISLYYFYKRYYTSYLSGVKICIEKQFLKTIFWYASFVFLWASAGTILSQIDMQMVIFMLGTTDAWYYTNYLSIIGIPFMIIWPFTFWFLLPVFSELHAKKDLVSIRKIKELFQKNLLILWIAFNILFFVFAETIAFVLFWEKFINSGTILQYSVLFLCFNFLLQINFNILAGIGKIKEKVKIVLTAIIFNTIWNYFLIQHIWVYGAALATAFGWILIWFLSEKILWTKYKIPFDYSIMLKNILFFSLFWTLLFFLKPFISLDASRLIAFWIMWIISLIWFWTFLFINKKESALFIAEIKKIRRG